MTCPRCNTPAHTAQLDTLNLDICPSCSGIWFDRNELVNLVRRIEQHHLPPLQIPTRVLEAVPVPMDARAAHALKPHACPTCSQEMQRRIYAGNANFWIDACEACGGIWLDGGELGMLLGMLKEKPAEDALIRAMVEYGKVKDRELRDVPTPAQLLFGLGGPRGMDLYTFILRLNETIDHVFGPPGDGKRW